MFWDDRAVRHPDEMVLGPTIDVIWKSRPRLSAPERRQPRATSETCLAGRPLGARGLTDLYGLTPGYLVRRSRATVYMPSL